MPHISPFQATFSTNSPVLHPTSSSTCIHICMRAGSPHTACRRPDPSAAQLTLNSIFPIPCPTPCPGAAPYPVESDIPRHQFPLLLHSLPSALVHIVTCF